MSGFLKTGSSHRTEAVYSYPVLRMGRFNSTWLKLGFLIPRQEAEEWVRPTYMVTYPFDVNSR